MRKYEFEEGRDYLIDYYAILGVDRFSDEKICRAAYRKMIKENHPDIVDRASEDIKNKARAKTDLLERAKKKLLSGKKIKSEYDAQFENFDEKHITNFSGGVVDLSKKGITKVLVSDMAQNIDSGYENISAHLEMMSGHDPKIFKRIEDLYNATENPDDDLIEEYKTLLVKKNILYEFNDELLWDDAGVVNVDRLNKQLTDPEDIVERRFELIKDIGEMISKETENLLLDYDKGNLKLLDGNGNNLDLSIETNRQKFKTEISKRAREFFDKRKAKLEENARERSKNLRKLLKLTKWKYLGEQTGTKNLLILGDYVGLLSCIGVFSYDQNHTSIETPPLDDLDSPRYTMDILNETNFKGNIFDSYMKFGKSDIALVYLNPEIDWMVQICYVVDEHKKHFTQNDAV